MDDLSKNFAAAMAASLSLLAALALNGCGRDTPASAQGSPGSREQRYTQMATRFGEALQKQDYTAAYRMMSPDYRAAVSSDLFDQQHVKARADFGVGPRMSVRIAVLGAALAGADSARIYGFSPAIPDVNRLAFLHIVFDSKTDLNDEGDATYRCAVLIVNDADGIESIGSFEYEWDE